jgi:hypothetical protein
MSKVVLKVKKENLINWYFDNWDRHKVYMFLNNVKQDILLSGEYILRVEEIADRLGYIPSNILEGEHDVMEYQVWDELILI